MKKLLFFVFAFLTATGSFAQSNQGTRQKTIEEKLINLEGTYQLQVINVRQQPLIPENLADIIVNNRDQNKVKYVQIADRVRLKILPVNEISKPNYSHLEKVAFINE